MANYTCTDTELTSIANAIRTKGGTQASLEYPTGFVTAIGNISTGTDTSDATAVAGDILSGKTAYAAGVKLTGTIASKAAETITPTTTDQTIASGQYLSGAQTVKGDANLVAANIANGVSIFGVTGSGSLKVDQKQINFIDYDGDIIYSYTAEEINAMTSESDLPANPTHTGLTAQGWNWTLAQIKAQLTAAPGGDVWVGQLYVTESGDTEIDIVLKEGRLSPYLTIAVYGTVTVDWGDNTVADEVSGSSTTTRQMGVHHTYAASGAYTIKIHPVSVSVRYRFYGSSTYVLLRKGDTRLENYVYSDSVKAVRIGNNVPSLGDYAFYYCMSLKYVTIPTTCNTSIGEAAFEYCYSLKSVTLPDNPGQLMGDTFSYCYSLKRVSIPPSILNFGYNAFLECSSLKSITIPAGVGPVNGYTFYYCHSLEKIVWPTPASSYKYVGSYLAENCYSLKTVIIAEGVTEIRTRAFYACNSLSTVVFPSTLTTIRSSSFYLCLALSTITIPANVTTIEASAFYGCQGLAEIHLLPTAPPTLSNANAFYNLPSDAIIYVPSGSLSTYQSANNWSTYASQMVGE